MVGNARQGRGERRERRIAEVVASGCRPRAQDLLEPEQELALEPADWSAGDVVLVERGAGRGRWRRLGPVLARGGSARAEVYRIAASHRLSPLHPEEVLREAEGWVCDPGIGDPSLVDLRGIPFITIDNPRSRDLDQALHIERSIGGRGFTVRYALADASYYVRPGSALFADALARGTSFYLPGLTLPMLPPLLCEGLISLLEGQSRRSLLFEMELDEDGECRRTVIRRTLVQSARKLSYPRVQRYLDDPAGSGWRDAPWRPTLDLLREVGELRIAGARRRHVLRPQRSEVEVTLAEGERLGFSILCDRRLEVERYNEQISLMCNVEGARMMAAAGRAEHVQPVFRVHPAPPDSALDSLVELIAGLVAEHGLDPGQWAWRRSEPLADYLGRLPVRGRWARLSRAIERQAQLLNERSSFEERPAPHHGIGAPMYARFSAPMREIVGVFTHKEALEALDGPASASPSQEDEELRVRVLEAGNRARDVQRSLTKEVNLLGLDRLFVRETELPEHERPRRRATIMGLTSSRLHLQLDHPTLDLKLYVDDLERQLGERLTVTPRGTALSGARCTFRIGDPITVVVAGLDQGRRRWLFRVVDAGAVGGAG